MAILFALEAVLLQVRVAVHVGQGLGRVFGVEWRLVKVARGDRKLLEHGVAAGDEPRLLT